MDKSGHALCQIMMLYKLYLSVLFSGGNKGFFSPGKGRANSSLF